MTLNYKPNPAGIDFGTYDLGETNTASRFADDQRLQQSHYRHLPVLAESDNWEDRIRAVVVRDSMRITLPDRFPAIFERSDSPNRSGRKNPMPHPWVKSPDVEMLQALLPDYQALWDAYTDQWGPDRRRVMEVGYLTGMTPHGTYRPGTTPVQVLSATIALHNMRAWAPDHMKAAVDEWRQAEMDRSRAAVRPRQVG